MCFTRNQTMVSTYYQPPSIQTFKLAKMVVMSDNLISKINVAITQQKNLVMVQGNELDRSSEALKLSSGRYFDRLAVPIKSKCPRRPVSA